jgi:hypothetical protein
VFENRVLRGISGPKRDEVTGGWRKLHNEELHNLYSSPNTSKIGLMKSRRMRGAGPVARMGKKVNAYRIYVGKAVGKRLLGKSRRRWVNNTKIDPGYTELGAMDWIDHL